MAPLHARSSPSLFTTAAGLIIAIPAMAFYFYFRGRVQWLIGMMEDISEEFAERIAEVHGHASPARETYGGD